MLAAERIAAQPEVLNGGWIVLDTMLREQQMSGPFMYAVYTSQGRAAPKVATQDWYERQGYVVFAEKKGGYIWADPITGERTDVDCVILRKKLSR